MGAIGGLVGALFNHMNIKLMKFRNNYVKSRLLNVVESILLASVTAIVGFALSFFFNSDCDSKHNMVGKHGAQMFCDDGQVNAMSGLFFQTPERSVQSMFHDPMGTHKPETLFIFFLAMYVLVMWTYGIAVSSGVFVPGLLIGSIWGKLLQEEKKNAVI